MTVKELAALLRVSPQTVYKMVEQGRLPALRIGTQWRFDRARVERWIQQGGSGFTQAVSGTTLSADALRDEPANDARASAASDD